MSFPAQARIIIIGGGVVGCSIAYHLTKLGLRDVLLLERKQLTSGTTWHAAGLVRSAQYTQNLTRLSKYTVDLYRRLEAETGQNTGFTQPGSISIATTNERLEELTRGMDMLRSFGVDAERISARRAQEKWPLMTIDDVVGAIWYPTDGKCNPIDVCMALARGARQGGARIVENVAVRRVLIEKGAVVGVETERGEARCEIVVNCAGMWARDLGLQAGVDIPLQACEHFYLVTDPIEGMRADLPVMRDMDHRAYFKEEAGKLLLGAFEPVAKPWAVDGIPDDFCFGELPEDFDHFQPILDDAIRRMPALEYVGVRKFFNGPESFSADGRYIIGPAPTLRGYFVAAGFNSIGIQSAGGVGMAMAHWIAEGDAPFDLWDVDVGRFFPHQNKKSFLIPRVSESLGLLYAMHWPFRQYESSRGARVSPLHERIAAARACFGEAAGYERPNWFAEPGQEPRYVYSYGRQNWFEASRAEHVAAREAVALFDLSCYAKFEVKGPDALAVLERLSCNRVDVEPGRAVYTQWLNSRGGIEADLTIFRIEAERFLVVTSCATSLRDWRRLRAAIGEGERVDVADVSDDFAMLGLMGPRARRTLAGLVDAPLDSAAFPFGATRSLDVAGVTTRATRVSYVGELGWELLAPRAQAIRLFDALVAAGEPHGLKLAGYHALNSLRIEKAFRHWGHDVTADDTPLEAGLGFCVAWDKPGGFVGREALIARRGAAFERRLLQFVLNDPEPMLYHDEPIWRDGARVGRVTSGMYGHTLGAAVGLGYVAAPDLSDAASLEQGRWEIEVAGRMIPARASLKPLYDPAGARMRA